MKKFTDLKVQKRICFNPYLTTTRFKPKAKGPQHGILSVNKTYICMRISMEFRNKIQNSKQPNRTPAESHRHLSGLSLLVNFLGSCLRERKVDNSCLRIKFTGHYRATYGKHDAFETSVLWLFLTYAARWETYYYINFIIRRYQWMRLWTINTICILDTFSFEWIQLENVWIQHMPKQ